MEENLIPFTYKWKLVAIIATFAIISTGIIPFTSHSRSAFLTPPILTNGTVQQNPDSINITISKSDNVSNTPSKTILLPTPKPNPHLEPIVPVIYNIGLPTYNFNDDTNTIEPIPIAPIMLNETVAIQTAINALGPMGGEITLLSDAIISSADLIITSNIILSGANPNITLHLDSKCLNIEKNAFNVTIKDLVIDASNLGNLSVLTVFAGAQNVSIQNIIIQNDISEKDAVLTLGNYVEIQNLTFSNVPNSYPIQINGSHSIVKNCRSIDQSTFHLVRVMGGITDIHIDGNLAENRPLFDGGITLASSSYIWIQNNTLINFPNGTYGILVMGGTLEPFKAPFDKVFVLGNNVTAAVGAYNAIAIYGLSSNVLVANNTVDQTLSGHNAIAAASGVNVTITQNTVFGCIEGAEGGIEVESNPVHNRFTGISENVNVTNNVIFGSQWGIYVRIMVPDHINWGGNPLKSKNIFIEGNIISTCTIGINLLYGDGIIVRNNTLIDNTKSFEIDETNVLNYTITNNVSKTDYLP
jgi:parallel beta-helix repeat protein